jgi:hypothetical protein
MWVSIEEAPISRQGGGWRQEDRLRQVEKAKVKRGDASDYLVRPQASNLKPLEAR